MIAITLDQQRSRAGGDLVSEWSRNLNCEFKENLRVPFVRTSGDEMQAVAGAGALGGIVGQALRSGAWWIGIGLGEIEHPLPADTREGRGPAFWNAREAVEKAKTRRRRRPLAVVGEKSETAVRLEQCLNTLAYVINHRTPSQQEAAREFTRTGGSIQAIADRLGISVQGATKNVRMAGCEEEVELISLAGWIVDPVENDDPDR